MNQPPKEGRLIHNYIVLDFMFFALMYIFKGLRIDPWGTPDDTFVQFDVQLPLVFFQSRKLECVALYSSFQKAPLVIITDTTIYIRL